MSKLNFIVPNPDGSGRYCVYDPTAGRFVRGGVNVSRLEAERLVRDVRPLAWEDLARAAGWIPPDEAEQQLEEQAALTEEALKETPIMQEQPTRDEQSLPPVPGFFVGDEL